MKRSIIAATIAALTIPVVAAVPARAGDIPFTHPGDTTYDVVFSADNYGGKYPLSVWGKATCPDGSTSVIGSPDAPEVLAPGDDRGMTHFCEMPGDGDAFNASTHAPPTLFEFELTANGISVHCNGEFTVDLEHDVVGIYTGDPACRAYEKQWYNANFVSMLRADDPTVVNIHLRPWYILNDADLDTYFKTLESGSIGYLKVNELPADFPFLGTRPLTDVVASADTEVGNNSVGKGFNERSKSPNSGYVTRNPNRVTAMAQRFVDAPGSPINIHGYGLNREKALSRANHVRDHLAAEITRLGGDPADYPTFVMYGGDPDHKKNTHVTIHQHGTSNITVPEDGTLTIGGSS